MVEGACVHADAHVRIAHDLGNGKIVAELEAIEIAVAGDGECSHAAWGEYRDASRLAIIGLWWTAPPRDTEMADSMDPWIDHCEFGPPLGRFLLPRLSGFVRNLLDAVAFDM
jgi:hypothetical protein